MSKECCEAAESAQARLCEWRGLNGIPLDIHLRKHYCVKDNTNMLEMEK